jgi:dTDP-4-dehydrorhamnose 3,5-epimerase
MRATTTSLPGVLVLEPKVFEDGRGFFFESYSRRQFEQSTGIRATFVQDNHTRSSRNALHGLHYQIRHPQGKLVRVISGEIYDVAVDIRRSSPAFGKWLGMNLSAEDKRMLWIPEGFAHGFVVLSEYAEVLYKVTDYWAPEHERCIRWNDPDLAIDWPITKDPMLSSKDRAGVLFQDAEVFP